MIFTPTAGRCQPALFLAAGTVSCHTPWQMVTLGFESRDVAFNFRRMEVGKNVQRRILLTTLGLEVILGRASEDQVVVRHNTALQYAKPMNHLPGPWAVILEPSLQVTRNTVQCLLLTSSPFS